MRHFVQDVRYGIRMLTKSPGFTTVGVLTLALGIGANTAIFSVVRAVLLKSLPYPEPDRLVSIREVQSHTGDMSVSWMNFHDWREQSQSFERLAVTRADRFILTGAGEPAQLRAGRVSAAFFPLLGAKPIVGRTFSEAEDAPSAAPATVLSYALWRTRFGADAMRSEQYGRFDVCGRRGCPVSCCGRRVLHPGAPRDARRSDGRAALRIKFVREFFQG